MAPYPPHISAIYFYPHPEEVKNYNYQLSIINTCHGIKVALILTNSRGFLTAGPESVPWGGSPHI